MEISQKVQLTDMCNSQGWTLATKLGQSLLSEMERLALDCDDDNKVAGLVREAKAARKFWDAFVSNIDTAKNPEITEGFNEVSY